MQNIKDFDTEFTRLSALLKTAEKARIEAEARATESDRKLGAELRWARIKRGWTQDFVARNVGVSIDEVRLVEETGQRQPYYCDRFFRLLEKRRAEPHRA